MSTAADKNSEYLKEYKNEFESALDNNKREIMNLLQAIEEGYTKRITEMKNAQIMCEKSVEEIKKINDFSKSFKEQSEKICSDVMKMTNNNNTVMESVKEMKIDIVKEIKNSEKSKGTYAEQLKKSVGVSAPVILKPKAKQESEKTKSEIKEKIKPSELNVGVSAIVNRQDGAVAIRCENNEARSKLANEMKEKMSEKYDVHMPKMRLPKILITGLSENMEGANIIEAIQKQNNVECEEIKCIKVYRSHKNDRVFNALLEIDGKGFESVMSLRKINIEWDRCSVYESLSVLRCFKCWGFNHTSTHCKESCQVCAKCGDEGHTFKNCPNENKKCINCKKAKKNAKFK